VLRRPASTYLCHYLRNAREVLDAERWLRERLSTGGVEAESSFLTRWDEQMRQVVVVVGELMDFLAGVGVPESLEDDNRGDC
jgi:hypothetical protein